MPTTNDLIQQLVEAAIAMNKTVLADIKASRKWVYYNSGQKSTFDLARQTGVLRVNCALGVIWCYRKVGLFQKTGTFYAKNGKFQWSEATKKKILKKFDLIDYEGKHTTKYLVEKGKIKPGDIVSFSIMTHVDMYLGNGKWFDTGHAYCTRLGDGAPFKKWIGDNPYPTYKVGQVLRLKDNAQPTPEQKNQRVQIGAYDEEQNAINAVSTCKKKTGLDAFYEQGSDKKYRVFCGSF